MATSVMAYPGSTRVGSALDIRMRREARRSRAVLQVKTGHQPEMDPPVQTSKGQQIPKEASRSTEESKKELAGWLRTMKSFVLGTDPTNALVEKALKLGTLPSSVSSSAAVFDPMEVELSSTKQMLLFLLKVLDDEFFTYSGGKDADREFHGSGILE